MQKKLSVTVGVFFLTAAVLMLSVVHWSGCQKSDGIPVSSSDDIQNSAVLQMTNPQIASVMALQNKFTPDIMANKAVVGTATFVRDDGTAYIKIFVKDQTYSLQKGKGIAALALPTTIENVPVEVEETGEFRILGTEAVNHKSKQTPPIQLGTSGGWKYDLANGYCCGGTLGSLVQIGSVQYILSNYHVLRADIVSGGNGKVATNGDPIIQPGLIDVSCNSANAQDVATLAGNASLPGSNVDCAIAQIISGMVKTDGSILEVGTISKNTVAPALRMKVKKSGRTSGLTRSTISGLNATISVVYENECAGGTAFTKTFKNQIVIKGGTFIQSGDSGSLMVEDKASNPRAVGLCFAGSSKYGIANPITEVLTYLGASMVGN